METSRWRTAGLAFGAVVLAAIIWGLATQRVTLGALLVCAGIVVFAVLINGLVAIVEDDLPGGFNNPDGRSTPPYMSVLSKVSHLLLVVALLATAILLLVLAHGAGWATVEGVSLAAFAIACGFAYVLLRRNRTFGIVGLIIFAGIPAIALWWKNVG